MKNLLLRLSILLFVFSMTGVYGQQAPNAGARYESEANSNQGIVFGQIDSLRYQYYSLDDLNKFKSFDTTNSISQIFVDPIRNPDMNRINLGNSGSASYPLLFSYTPNTVFSPGYRQYIPYLITPQNFRFFNQNNPVSNVGFSQLGNQQNIVVNADFSRNFSGGLGVDLNYWRVSHEGFYNNQETKSTNFGLSLSYQSPSKKYIAYGIIIHNANQENNNGGLSDINGLDSIEFVSLAPTYLAEANTRHQEQYLGLLQFLRLNKSASSPFTLSLRNDLIYNPSYFKYSDKIVNTSGDSIIYGSFLTDARGVRRIVNVNHIQNTFSIIGHNRKNLSGRIGLALDYFSITNNGNNTKRFDISLQWNGVIPIGKTFNIVSKANIGVGQNVGSFDAMGSINISLARIVNMEVGIQFYNSMPTQQERLLYSNEDLLFSKDFNKVLGTSFFAKLFVPSLNLKASASQQIINNLIYWDEDRNARQADGVITITQLNVDSKVKFWKLHFDNQLFLQYINSKVLPLPQIFSTHQFYFGSKVFRKAMDLKFGINARLIPQFEGAAYDPLIGIFYKSNTQLPFVPDYSIFLLAKVERFKVLLQMENFGQNYAKTHNADIVNYPQNEAKLRFGIYWLLVD